MKSSPAPSESAATVTIAQRYGVYVVENYEGDAGTEKSSWTRLGVAFAHKDNKGLNVELRALPVSGKLVIRLHEPSDRGVD